MAHGFTHHAVPLPSAVGSSLARLTRGRGRACSATASRHTPSGALSPTARGAGRGGGCSAVRLPRLARRVAAQLFVAPGEQPPALVALLRAPAPPKVALEARPEPLGDDDVGLLRRVCSLDRAPRRREPPRRRRRQRAAARQRDQRDRRSRGARAPRQRRRRRARAVVQGGAVARRRDPPRAARGGRCARHGADGHARATRHSHCDRYSSSWGSRRRLPIEHL